MPYMTICTLFCAGRLIYKQIKDLNNQKGESHYIISSEEPKRWGSTIQTWQLISIGVIVVRASLDVYIG